MPNALMEAMAIGVPCISTNCPCGGPASLITEEEQGFLIPVGNEEALATKMRILLGNEVLRNRMRNAARLRAQDFRPEKVVEQWDNYINLICDSRYKK